MKISPERFATIIEAYGSQPGRWPTDERAAASDYLAQSAQAQALVAEYQVLDEWLDHYRIVSLPALEQHVINQAQNISTGNAFDRLMDWLLPHSGRVLAWVWRPTMVACLPLICGIYLADYFSFGIDGTQNSWEEELYLLSLNDYAETLE
ncbi:MAG: hypothetical protein Q8L60_14020 [Gammaproteobacteria bacterium]|nr:hypothetical protein [Gammaproteobacteria bacterium]MDP2142128.1 hypothetical protein [Gammaproteobacteria bacterium]MDP2348264.1 hypothetical protein [Gammaproteobacteria bacterium]